MAETKPVGVKAQEGRREAEVRFNSLMSEGSSWEPGWKDIQKYIKPTRGFFSGQTPNDGKKIDHKTILDGHASKAARTLASGMTSGLTSPSRPWFKLGIADHELMKADSVKRWLADVQQRMMAVFSKSNIYPALYAIYEELGSFGTAACAILEDFEDVIRARSFTVGEYWLGVDDKGRVNRFARQYWMTVGQLVKEFGEDAVSEGVRADYANKKLDRWLKVRHMIEPNDGRIVGYGDSKNMEYRSCYWECNSTDDQRFLRESGFEEFPILAPRWDLTTTADVYGRGPGWEALGDVKMLQTQVKNKLTAEGKVGDPPIQVDANVQGTPNALPGGVTRFSATASNAGAKPLYQVDPRTAEVDASIDRTHRQIDGWFFADMFLLMSNDDRSGTTAREIVERHTEKLQMLGPVLERLESEMLDPLIERTFKIMLRTGMIPPPPAELEGLEIDVEYISMLAQAQKAIGTTSLEQVASFAGGLAAVIPDVIDVLDGDESLREYADAVGVAPKTIRSPEEVAARREQKAQAAAAAAAPEQVKNAADAAKVLSETEIGKGTALDQVMGGAPPLLPNSSF